VSRKLQMQKRIQHTMTVGDGHKTMSPKLPDIVFDAGTTAQINGGVMQLQPGSKAYRMGECKIFVSPPTSLMGWHMSISHPRRYPTWDEIAKARYKLIPDETQIVMHLPPRDEYVAIHNYCFQLHELKAIP
jgi:hypothetical protein